jgi:alpha-tubulin suppressor-like RCC1 family protein
VWSNNYTTIPNLLIQSQTGLGRYQLYTNGGTSILNEGNAPTPSLWYHYAVVKNGTTYTIFRNGSATGVTTYNALTNAGSTTFRPEIGRGSGLYFLNGNIRDFRIYKGWAKYTTTFNPATATTAVVATTGTGFDKSINLGFQPDLVWVKARNIGRTSHILVDSVRGGTSTLSANSSDTATTSSNNVTFFQTGFTVGGSVSANATTIPAAPALFYGTGENSNGQLGLGDNSDRNQFTPLTGNWSQMVCGLVHTMALSTGTTKWFGTGSDGYGQLGLGNNPGYNTYGGSGISYNAFTALTGNWSQMACGNYFTMALSAGTNKLFSTGYNEYGQLGIGTSDLFGTQNVNLFTTPLTGNWSQVVCGHSHTMALSTGTNKWFGAGYNGSGALGLIDNSDRNVLTPLTGNWSQMVCGAYHTMALSAGTTRWFGTGYNFDGALGLGDNSSRNAFTPLTGNWSQMVCGAYYTMALSAGTTRWFGTGSNSYGQLGLGDNSARNAFTPLTGNWSQMVCGAYHTMALSAGTTKWFSTGFNVNGQLGLIDNSNRNVFTALTGNWSQMACGNFQTMALSISSEENSTLRTATKSFNPALNTPGGTYTAYGWKRNALAGFDIVGFNKTAATNESFSHGLGKPPSMMIVKGYSPSTNTTTWITYHEQTNALPANGYLSLATQSGFTADSTIFNNTNPTASQFTLGTAWGTGPLGGAGVAYLFAEIPGFSRFGNYTANGSVDGPFVWCGFKPRFVMTKKASGNSDWLIWDSSRGPINPISPHFTVNNNAADNSTAAPTYNGYLDFTATGFKLRLSSAPNDTGTYVFAAFADSPFGRMPGQVLAV